MDQSIQDAMCVYDFKRLYRLTWKVESRTLYIRYYYIDSFCKSLGVVCNISTRTLGSFTINSIQFFSDADEAAFMLAISSLKIQ
jgi:hypothetical protein